MVVRVGGNRDPAHKAKARRRHHPRHHCLRRFPTLQHLCVCVWVCVWRQRERERERERDRERERERTNSRFSDVGGALTGSNPLWEIVFMMNTRPEEILKEQTVSLPDSESKNCEWGCCRYEMCSGSQEGSYIRLIDLCGTQL